MLAEHDRHRGTVLMAGADAETAALIHHHLETRNVQVIDVSEESLPEFAARSDVDVIILDADASARSPFETMHLLTTDEHGSTVPVILLTDGADPGPILDALEVGAFDHLEKPLVPATLSARVEAGLMVKHLRKDLLRERQDRHRYERVDPITGLYNRAQLVVELERELALAQRYRRTLSACVITIENLHTVAASDGLLTAEQLMRGAAVSFSAELRRCDVGGRLAQEQFLAILPATDSVGAHSFALRTSAALRALRFRNMERVSITPSVGFACLENTDQTELMTWVSAAATTRPSPL